MRFAVAAGPVPFVAPAPARSEPIGPLSPRTPSLSNGLPGLLSVDVPRAAGIPSRGAACDTLNALIGKADSFSPIPRNPPMPTTA